MHIIFNLLFTFLVHLLSPFIVFFQPFTLIYCFSQFYCTYIISCYWPGIFIFHYSLLFLVPRLLAFYTIYLYIYISSFLRCFLVGGPTTLGVVVGPVYPLGVPSRGRLWSGRLEGSAPWCRASCLPGLGRSWWQHPLQTWTLTPLAVCGPQWQPFPHLGAQSQAMSPQQ